MNDTWSRLRRHHRRQLLLLGLVVALILIPWMLGLAAGFWFMLQQGWAWYWWAGSVLLLVLALLMLRLLFRPRQPVRLLDLPDRRFGASQAEQAARKALQERMETVDSNALRDLDAGAALIQATFNDVAQAYAPDDPVAFWRFTAPELLLMVEDFAQRLRNNLLIDFPMLRHLELSWVVSLASLGGPVGTLFGLSRIMRWINPVSAITAELRDSIASRASQGLSNSVKAQLAVVLIEQAGETAIKLYSGRYRRRSDELRPTAPTPETERPDEPLTLLLAGQPNAGKSALLNALLGETRQTVGLLSASPPECRAYAFEHPRLGTLILVDCPGVEAPTTGGWPARTPWLAQAARSDLVIWVAAANRADRALDQHALAALDALTERRPTLRRIPRLLALTHADQLDPPLEWSPPYDPDGGQQPKEIEMREARRAACEQLHIPLQASALLALRPGQPPWNQDALLNAIAQALPEAQQKQLERAMAKAGWLSTTKDAVVSLPATLNRLVGTGRRALLRDLERRLKR